MTSRSGSAHVMVKPATRTVEAVATILHDGLDVSTLDADNRTMGCFIVIDEVTDATVGAGMVAAA